MDASLEVSLIPFNVRRSRRTVRWRPRHRTIPLRRSSGLSRTHAFGRPVLAVFHASRLVSFLCVCETPPVRVIRRRRLSPAFRARTRAVIATRPGVFSARRRSWDFRNPSQCSSDSRAANTSSAWPSPPVVSRHDPPRVSSSRGPPVKADHESCAAAPGLCDSPSSQPYRAVRRPRHGFCA